MICEVVFRSGWIYDYYVVASCQGGKSFDYTIMGSGEKRDENFGGACDITPGVCQLPGTTVALMSHRENRTCGRPFCSRQENHDVIVSTNYL